MDVAEFVKLAFARGDLIGLLGAIVVLGFGLYMKARPAPKADGVKLEKVVLRLDGVDQRLGRVESELKHMPTNSDIHDMEVKLVRQGERIIGIERTTEATGRAVGRIEDFMLSMKRE